MKSAPASPATPAKQAALFGVRCHLDHEVSAEDIQTFNPDLIILATGSLPLLPPVEGIDKDIVLTCEDVLRKSLRSTVFIEIIPI